MAKGFKNLTSVQNPETGTSKTGQFIVLDKMTISAQGGECQFTFDYYDSEAAYDAGRDKVRWLEEKFNLFVVNLTKAQVDALLTDVYGTIKSGLENKLGVSLQIIS